MVANSPHAIRSLLSCLLAVTLRCLCVAYGISLSWTRASMADPLEDEFLSLDATQFGADEAHSSSPFDTLWTEFTRRSHNDLLSPRTPTRSSRLVRSSENLVVHPKATIELRNLEYVSEYDSNLMCPICHVPLIDPVVLDCDHTFCAECFSEYRNGGGSTERAKCPTCRAYHLGASKKASRLIKNMCNDILVRCPNNECGLVMARGCIEQHATRECLDQLLLCPDSECSRQTKRRNYVPDQCIHSTHIECDCGASIRLGRGEWIKHKDQECPNTMSTAAASQEHSSTTDNDSSIHVICPGSDFGCTDTLTPSDLPTHTTSCPFARLAPHFKKQATLLQSLQDQLKMTQIRNEVLETSFDRLHEVITNTIQPKLEALDHEDNASISSIEEIPRSQHNLSVLPAHLRELTPSPGHQQVNLHAETQSFPDPTPRITALESHLAQLQSNLTDLDARSSMALMNETLRIREELAHINGAMYSTRAQVQWLLNRERMLGQREAMARGRIGAPSAIVEQGQNATGGAGASTAQAAATAGVSGSASASTGTQRPSIDRNLSSAWSTSQAANAGGVGSGPSSAATSPMFGAARPSLRRSSDGSSRERVKL